MKTHKNKNVKVNDISGVNDAVRDPEKEAMKAENEELRKMVMNLITTTREMVPKIGNNNVSINVFLNETIKIMIIRWGKRYMK